MAFVKTVKNNAYYKRYQTAYRRRREGKTDYYARKRLIIQDKDKYNSPKYRLCVRISNKRVQTQIIYATLTGDRVLCQANSSELKKFGITCGLTNYASAYCTGLLISRRLLKQLKMDTTYKGVEKVTGEEYNVEDDEGDRRPFKCVLDVGLVHTTTGNRVFGVLKGAIDGGLLIPYSEKRFPGYTEGEDDEGANYDAKVHRDRIFGVHVDKYIAELKENDAEAYKKQFGKWDAALKSAGVTKVEQLFQKAHGLIRKTPEFTKNTVKVSEKKYKPKQKLTKAERAKRVQAKIKKMLGKGKSKK